MNCHPKHLLYRTLEISYRRGDSSSVSTRLPHPSLFYVTSAGAFGASSEVTDWIESDEQAANIIRTFSRCQGFPGKTVSGTHLNGILKFVFTSPWQRFADVFTPFPSRSGFMATASFGELQSEVTVHISPSNLLVGTAKLQDNRSATYSIEFDFKAGFDENHSILVFQSSDNPTNRIISQILHPAHSPVNVTCGAAADQPRLAGGIVTERVYVTPLNAISKEQPLSYALISLESMKGTTNLCAPTTGAVFPHVALQQESSGSFGEGSWWIGLQEQEEELMYEKEYISLR
ncbi:hypothetical protein LZ30DRAFT_814938 [Colletotrichum cereale]|nr:hypothetical protein LZ30DRAFT_814938 [Colletotrichum cereale]